MEPLRKLLSILMAAVLGLTFVAPLLAAYGQVPDGWLPACCRRLGAHHCAMNMDMAKKLAAAAGDNPVWTTTSKCCPCYPAAVTTGHFHETLAAAPAQALYAEIASYGLCPVQTEAKRRVSRDRSRQKRGPPVELLSL